MLSERLINILENIKVPNTYWKDRTVMYKYWFRSLLEKIDSSIIFNNLPDMWNDDFFHICLWALGFVAVFKSPTIEIGKKYGPIVFNPCTITGYDFYYQPVKAIVSNPNLDNVFTKEFSIGSDCELIKLTPDFIGVLDIIDYYASKLAEISKGIDVGLINAKMPLILTAKNDAQAETLKKVFDKVQAGESLIIWKNEVDHDELMPVKDPFESFVNDYQKTYVVHNLLEDMQNILNSFYSEIGIPVTIDKKERLITSETDFATAQSQARISTWIETLKESLIKVNSMFNINITAEIAYNIDNVASDNSNDNEDIEI